MVIQVVEFDVVRIPTQNGRMTNTNEPAKPPKKPSSVRHTRAIQRDRSKRPNVAPPDDKIAERLTEIIHPATQAQLAYYRSLGLRERVLTLPVMVALVLSMVWRQIGAVSELAKMLRDTGLLWAEKQRLTQQALSERFRTFPAILFLRVLQAVLPLMHARWQSRQRPSKMTRWSRFRPSCLRLKFHL